MMKELDSTAISFLFKAGLGAGAGSEAEADAGSLAFMAGSVAKSGSAAFTTLAESGSAAFIAEDIVVGVQYTLPMELAVMLVLYLMGVDDVNGFWK